MHRHLLLFALAVVVTLAAGCASTPPNPNPRANAELELAPQVDLDRYMGRWYIIANIPYVAERGYVGSYVEYRRRDDGRIDDFYFGRKKSFELPITEHDLVDDVVADTQNAKWRACWFGPICFSYLILYVDPDYRYALIGYPGKELGWIFARDAEVDEATYRSLLARFDAQGYDTSLFRRVPQTPAQIGLPGFQ
jgi:apolipoprotein D and lipocalin family protein